MQITFATEQAHSAFHAMAEGMLEVERDDACGDASPRAAEIERTIAETPSADVYPATFTLSSTIARDIIENMVDDEDFTDDITTTAAVTPLATEMLTREALQEAIAALTMRASETDTASPEGHRARLAIEHIERMLEQRGLEVFKNGDDGSLPDFCDVVIYG
jgi:hypothetical protein